MAAFQNVGRVERAIGFVHIDAGWNRVYPIDAQKDGAASLDGVFAGGDIVSGDATVIWAMGSAKRAAAAIDAYLKGCKDA